MFRTTQKNKNSTVSLLRFFLQPFKIICEMPSMSLSTLQTFSIITNVPDR